MVERHQMVTGTSEDGAEFASMDGVYVQEQTADQWTILLDLEHANVESLEAAGLTNTSTAPVTLEELFVARMKGMVQK